MFCIHCCTKIENKQTRKQKQYFSIIKEHEENCMIINRQRKQHLPDIVFDVDISHGHAW